MRRYGKQARRPKADLFFAERAQSPDRKGPEPEDPISKLTEQLTSITLEEKEEAISRPCSAREPAEPESDSAHSTDAGQDELRVLTWADVCPPGDRIEKIAEASYAEVYRVTNERGTSIIRSSGLESPIKPQTKAQERSGLVDEEPHPEDDLLGELRISEWLADIPGFVVYKEQYVVRGRAPKALLETHQTSTAR